jgi:hypothetical protein
LDHARLANRFTPVLHNFNAQGERIDSIEFHPSWHALMQGITARGPVETLPGPAHMRRAPRATSCRRRSRAAPCARPP